MSNLKAGIIGCGRMGRERARCITALGAHVAAVFDVDPLRMQELARSYNSKAAASVEECLSTDLDALFVCTAPGTRGQAEENALHRGLPLFVEKPIGISLNSCQGILRLLESKHGINAVGYMNRYRQSIQVVRELLQDREIIGLSGHWVCKRYNVPWWSDSAASGGPHNEQATHLFDLFRYLGGEITQVQSMFYEASRTATVTRFQTGTVGTLFYSCDGSEKDIGLRIFTSRGSLTLSGWDFSLTENSVDGQVVLSADEDIFRKETDAFLNAVRSGRPGLIESDFPDAARTQAVVDAARQSSQLAQGMDVRELEPVL